MKILKLESIDGEIESQVLIHIKMELLFTSNRNQIPQTYCFNFKYLTLFITVSEIKIAIIRELNRELSR